MGEISNEPLPTAVQILREGLAMARDRNVGAVDIDRAHLLLDFARELREGAARELDETVMMTVDGSLTRLPVELVEHIRQLIEERDRAMQQATYLMQGTSERDRQVAEWKGLAEREAREHKKGREAMAGWKASAEQLQEDLTAWRNRAVNAEAECSRWRDNAQAKAEGATQIIERPADIRFFGDTAVTFPGAPWPSAEEPPEKLPGEDTAHEA